MDGRPWGATIHSVAKTEWLHFQLRVKVRVSWTSLVAQLAKNPPAMWETWVWSLGWEDPLEKGRLPIPVFWPGEFHGPYSPRGWKESLLRVSSFGYKALVFILFTACYFLVFLLYCFFFLLLLSDKCSLYFGYLINHFLPDYQFNSVQSLSLSDSATPWTAACQASLSITNSQSLPKRMSTESVMPSNHLILCHPLLLPSSIFPSIRVFSSESVLCIRWPKFWSFSFSISPSNEYSGLISFRMDWLDLVEVQGTLKSLLQHHSSEVSILWRSAFFTVQLSNPYMTTGKTIALTRRCFFF